MIEIKKLREQLSEMEQAQAYHHRTIVNMWTALRELDKLHYDYQEERNHHGGTYEDLRQARQELAEAREELVAIEKAVGTWDEYSSSDILMRVVRILNKGRAKRGDK